MDIFIILQLYRSVRLRHKQFLGKSKERKQQHYKKSK